MSWSRFFVMLAAFTSMLGGCAAALSPQGPMMGVDARLVIAVADGDFRASTYDDQILASSDPAFRDQLLVWTRPKTPPATIAASNSVTSPPEMLAVSPDGEFAYVVERLGQRSAGDVRTSDLSTGGRLTAVRLRNGSSRRSVVNIGPNPEAIDLRSDGRMLAAVSNSPTQSLVHLIPVDGGSLGRPVAFDLADLGIAGRAEGPRKGVTATSVFWRPGDSALAVTINTQDRVVFLRVKGTRNAPRLIRWGVPVPTGRDPFTGRFTPDGRHFLTLDWGRDLMAITLEDRLPTNPSHISVIRVASSSDASGSHRRIGAAATDFSSEGIAVSPDGTLVAAVNMRQTALSPKSSRYTAKASVVLLHFDGTSGALTPIDRMEFGGVLPEGATFDLSGRTLLVTSFERPDAGGGGLKIFGIRGGGLAARLEDRGMIATPHGIHHVVVR